MDPEETINSSWGRAWNNELLLQNRSRSNIWKNTNMNWFWKTVLWCHILYVDHMIDVKSIKQQNLIWKPVFPQGQTGRHSHRWSSSSRVLSCPRRRPASAASWSAIGRWRARRTSSERTGRRENNPRRRCEVPLELRVRGQWGGFTLWMLIFQYNYS